ncbi:MAG: hypothetical protein COU85_00255 [Candidatus Portnoybacteria bacterium CG10_big_fil_rev_8_21_14_0_10_44_7]|uniref:Uncharacterized protein n=1 Tax=Candidatus Portnoybacteria bacterium CG10_big_fil_rev_8_21_14_0_10_44_7 TaxID=1974816 RepID=A0A2M8KJH0_9BACT|nr:MAG: hypothetical protein COU85_00255 [Candidatus Portnoybacteria bacterium CG10_big_fil_rev_8_21_14_0_10_44_7]
MLLMFGGFEFFGHWLLRTISRLIQTSQTRTTQQMFLINSGRKHQPCQSAKPQVPHRTFNPEMGYFKRK